MEGARRDDQRQRGTREERAISPVPLLSSVEGGIGEREIEQGGVKEGKRSQEKGEVADLELPRSCGRLHPASSCAPREKDTLCSAVSQTWFHEIL